ncbi:MAG: UMP kinase [Mycoplasmataceae bacterium]|nr:UMP kinase [Mycoplasmataceae bacterium]
MKYKRILLKLSGEWLANKEKSLSIDYSLVDNIAIQLKKIREQKIEIAIVIGGGNFWRGASAEKNGIPRNRADYIGMLATIMNALALQSGFEKHGLKCRVQSSINIDPKVAENYITEKAKKYLSSGEIVIFAAGTGRPYFTTDTAATLVASEIEADIILLGKNKVTGIYDSDPNINADAKRYSSISYDEILSKNLKVIDSTAATMARDNNINALVFDIGTKDAILNVLNEKGLFTKVSK